MRTNSSLPHSDSWYMRKALALARKAASQHEVPVGALIVNEQGLIIGRGFNRVEQLNSQLEHAELRALRQATRKQNDWRLDECTVYITLEPCIMCLCALGLSRCRRIVYAARSPLFGGTVDKICLPSLYTKHLRLIESGLCADEAADLLKRFFKQKREGLYEQRTKNSHQKQTA